MEIRGFSIQYASRKKKERIKRFEEIQCKLESLEVDISNEPNNVKKLEEMGLAKTELETLNKYEAQGAAIRCKANYSVMGERPTRYFCALEKNNATSR
mgnify:FL=1